MQWQKEGTAIAKEKGVYKGRNPLYGKTVTVARVIYGKRDYGKMIE